MEWLNIDFSNLPNDEVLAANFNAGTYGYKEKIIGYLTDDGACGNEREMLMNCTHYIDLNKHDI